MGVGRPDRPVIFDLAESIAERAPVPRCFHVSAVEREDATRMVWYVSCGAPSIGYSPKFRLKIHKGAAVAHPCRIDTADLVGDSMAFANYVEALTMRGVQECRKHLKRYMRTLKHGYRTLPHDLEQAAAQKEAM